MKENFYESIQAKKAIIEKVMIKKFFFLEICSKRNVFCSE